MSRIVGGPANFTFDSIPVRFTSVVPKLAKDMADTTDSSNYDATSKIVWKSQLATTGQIELAVEGKFYLVAQGTISLITRCYNGNAAATGSLRLTATQVLFSGNWDISDFECTIDPSREVTFKCTLKSNGTPTVGAEPT